MILKHMLCKIFSFLASQRIASTAFYYTVTSVVNNLCMFQCGTLSKITATSDLTH